MTKKNYIDKEDINSEVQKCLKKYHELVNSSTPELDKANAEQLVKEKKFAKYSDAIRNIDHTRRIEALSKKLIDYFLLIAKNSARLRFYKDEQDKEDCISGSYIDLIKYWVGFESSGSDNAFAYFTTIATTGAGKQWNDLYPKRYKGTISMSANSTDTDQGMYSF